MKRIIILALLSCFINSVHCWSISAFIEDLSIRATDIAVIKVSQISNLKRTAKDAEILVKGDIVKALKNSSGNSLGIVMQASLTPINGILYLDDEIELKEGHEYLVFLKKINNKEYQLISTPFRSVYAVNKKHQVVTRYYSKKDNTFKSQYNQMSIKEMEKAIVDLLNHIHTDSAKSSPNPP